MDRIQTPTTPAAPTVDVPAILRAVATHLLATPTLAIGHLTITRTVLDIAGPAVSVTALRPVWDVLPLGGHGDRGYTHAEYASLLLATDSDPDMDEALRRARAPRQAVAPIRTADTCPVCKGTFETCTCTGTAPATPKQQTFDDGSDACPLCGYWTCQCGTQNTRQLAVAA